MQFNPEITWTEKRLIRANNIPNYLKGTGEDLGERCAYCNKLFDGQPTIKMLIANKRNRQTQFIICYACENDEFYIMSQLQKRL